MSHEIIVELTFFSCSVLFGIGVTFLYDWILIIRKVVSHGKVGEAIEDLGYWIGCAVGMFLLLYEQNSGILRWFAIAGATLGMLIYKKVIGLVFVQIMSTCLIKLLDVIKRVILGILKPLKWLKTKVFHQGIHQTGRWCKYCKKRLTASIKVLKITLCKR